MLTIGTVVLGVADVRRAADYWTPALHYVPREGTVADDPTWTVLIPADGIGAALALGLSATPAQQHPCVHLNPYAGDAANQAAEVKRLVALGAARVD